MLTHLFRYQFRLQSLMLATALIAVSLAVLRLAVVGKIQTEADGPDEIIFRTGSIANVSIKCTNPETARQLADSIDKNEFVATVIERLKVDPPDAMPAMRNVEIATSVRNSYFILSYDYSRWGCYHFSLSQLSYVLDISHPIARERNSAIHRAFLMAGDRIAANNQSVERCEHFPHP